MRAKPPSIALFLLLAAGISFISAVQAGVWARANYFTPGILKEWLRFVPPANRGEAFYAEADDLLTQNALWGKRFERLYHLGRSCFG